MIQELTIPGQIFPGGSANAPPTRPFPESLNTKEQDGRLHILLQWPVGRFDYMSMLFHDANCGAACSSRVRPFFWLQEVRSTFTDWFATPGATMVLVSL